MVLWRLAVSYFLVRKIRTALTVAAIAMSVSLVVSVTSGYASLEGAALKFLNHYMGAADALITARNPLQGAVPESLLQKLAADPNVRQVSGRLESVRFLPRPGAATRRNNHPEARMANGIPLEQVQVSLIGVFSGSDPAVASLDLTSGKWFDAGAGNVAVIDQVVEKKLAIPIGGEIELPGIHKIKLKVVGRVHKPAFFAERSGAIYMPIQTLQRFTSQDNPPQLTRISIDLRSGVSATEFEAHWDPILAAIDGNLHLRLSRDNAGDLEKALTSIHHLSYFGGVVSMLTAMFIIFTALVMGVSERQRTLALLRAIGATRSQIFRLVVLEGFLLALIGVVVGTAAGALWIHMIYWRFSDLFAAGVVFSFGGTFFAAVGSMLTALAASLLPAWSASRFSPLDAMNPLSLSPSRRPPIGWAILGAALAGLDPLILFGPLEHVLGTLGAAAPDQAARSVRFLGHFVVGLPGVVVGYFLIAPLLVWILERSLARPMAVLFFVPAKLLKEQLSGGLWRAAGTAAALMVGLASLIAMQVQGRTLIGGWRLPDKFPDIFIWSPDPISWADIKELAKTPGIQPGGLMPAVVTTPAGDSTTALALTAVTAGQNTSVMFFAIDPAQALRMVELEFRDDNGKPYPREQQPLLEAQAAKEMAKGRRIIVTDEFRQVRHVKNGDPFQIMTSVNGPQTYTICGIVWSPGVDVVISMFDLEGMLDRQTAGSVFGSIEDAKKDFGVKGARLFAADLGGPIEKEQLLRNVQKSLGERGMMAGDVRQIKFTLESAFYRLLSLISTIAVAALAVASLGVANTIMASVRSRRWQFGVLRSVGVCRGELLRMVLAEAVLLGLVGAVLGFSAGMELSVDAQEVGRAILGYSPALVVPWNMVALGSCSVLAIALLASLWPAFNVARAQPLQLLQAGRAST